MQNAFNIQIGFPLPKRGQGGANRIYPWDELKPGESFFVPPKKGEGVGTAARRLASCARQAGKKRGRVYLTRVRRADKHGEHGVRVWRLK